MRIDPIYLTFLNYLGGFEYFLFTSEKEYQVNTLDSGQVKQNIFSMWPKSYDQNADTIDRQTYRTSKRAIVVKSQHLTLNQRDVLLYIKTSPLVQIIESRTDRRTVIVDTNSFKSYSEDQKVFTIQFTINYTDDIPSQRL